ncbi:hypothetical protein KSP40_PGU008182 [Platanthera guangdongensis]|uniref:AIPP2-like SPOC-like domain-containing protein n=1 Tax=Platanthera guangdongensis TaxID=2320717 RepID=A0ABR2LSM1_9ASPA
MHETSKPPQSSSESESFMDKEDDVKVCDICGDAGQEDLLAICSRCIDGAEHVYCMRTMLDRIPVGDWFCEDCKFKEKYENQKAHKFHSIIKTQEESYLSEDTQNARNVISSEILHKKEEGAINLEDMVVSRRPQIAELYDENLDVNIHISEMASTKNPVPTETSVPREMLSPEDPFNNPDILLNKTSNPEQFSASCSIFEGQKTHTFSGPLLKSSSFKTANAKPKVKQLLGAVPSVENSTEKFASKTARKGVFIGQRVKSTLFKTGNEGCNSFELDNEKPSINIKEIEDLHVERDKELSLIERKKSSKVGLFQVEDNRISRGSVPTHSCSIDKHSVSAIMLSIDRLPCVNANRSNKWKVPGETAISKQAVKCTNMTNQSKELPLPSFGYSAKVVNKVLPPQCFKKTCLREGRTNATSGFVFDKSASAVNPHEIHSNPGSEGLNQSCDISREFEMEPTEQIHPSTEPCISNTLKASVIPKLEFFWQGCFEVPRKGRLPECCDGLQAHFSSNASGKVFEAAKELPPHKLQLEEVHFISCWPQHFHGNQAKENNIALFFFAKDIKSYINNYCKLLDNMLKYDLALKGKFGGFELLIFPSYKLAENSQRWNKLFFLWGIFKEGGQIS